MIKVVIVGIAISLILIVSAFYRGRRQRVTLLRIGCIALLIATVCRALGTPVDIPVIDLAKRLAILTAQVSIALLILTFRSTPPSALANRLIYLVGGLIALGEITVLWFIPLHPDGSILQREEIPVARDLEGAWALITYHCLYLGAFAASTAIVIIGCWRTLVQKGQPTTGKLPVAFVLAGAIGSALYITSSILDLFDLPILADKNTRTGLLVFVVTTFFIGLATGVVRRITITLRQTIALHLAQEIVMPLWRTTTSLHPDVRLPLDEQMKIDQLTQLSRLTIETHDALRLIREDDDPALAELHRKHPSDPELSAELLQHLSGDKAVPRLGWLTVALTRLRSLNLEGDRTLSTSLTTLYEIRLAMSARNGV